MPQAIPVITAVAGVASVVGTVSSIRSSKKAADASAKQNALQVARQRRQGIREAQLKRAQAVASAGGIGAGTSSGAFGGIGAVGSQLGADLGFGTQAGALSNIITKQTQRAQTFGAVAGLGSTVFGATGGFNTLFGGSS